MKTRSLKHLVVIFVLVVVLFLGRGLFDQVNAPQEPFMVLDETTITKVQLNGQTISRTEGDWMLDDPIAFDADDNRTQALIDALIHLESKGLIAESEEVHDRYDVGEALGREVALFDQEGNELQRVIIGKLAPGGRQSYVRRAGADEVYLVDGDLKSVVPADAGELRNLVITDLPAEEVVQLAISNETGKLSIIKDMTEGWLVDPDTKAQEEVVMKAVGTLSQLTAMDIMGIAEEIPREENHDAKIYISTGDKAYTLYFLKQEDEVFVAEEGSDVVYKVPSHPWDVVMQDVAMYQ